MNGAELVAQARIYLNDVVTPTEIPDNLLLQFINRAERELCSVGLLLRKVLTLKAQAGRRWVLYPESPEIIEIRTAMLIDSTNRYPLHLLGTNDAFAEEAWSSVATVGRPTHLFFGRNSDSVEIYPIPDKNYELECSAFVYPEEPISLTSEPSIPQQYHDLLPIGATYFALQVFDRIPKNSMRIKLLLPLWEQTCVRLRAQTSAKSRDYATVSFNNDYWGV